MAIFNLGGGGGEPELQSKTATPLITNAQQIIVPDTGYDGLSQVTVGPMPTGTLKTPTVNSIGYVSSGVQTAGFLDTSAVSGLQLSTQAAKTITPATYSQTAVASGKYTTGAVTVKGDSNLVASNIVRGASIFGISGTANVAHFVVSTASRLTNRKILFPMDSKIPDGYVPYVFTLYGSSGALSGALQNACPTAMYKDNSETSSSTRAFIIAFYLSSSPYNYTVSNITFSWQESVLTAELPSTSSMIFGESQYTVQAIYIKDGGIT